MVPPVYMGVPQMHAELILILSEDVKVDAEGKAELEPVETRTGFSLDLDVPLEKFRAALDKVMGQNHDDVLDSLFSMHPEQVTAAIAAFEKKKAEEAQKAEEKKKKDEAAKKKKADEAAAAAAAAKKKEDDEEAARKLAEAGK